MNSQPKTTETATTKGQKEKGKLGQNLQKLVGKMGGAEGVLDKVSSGTAKAAQLIRDKKGQVTVSGDEQGVTFDTGLRPNEKKEKLVLGMPPIAAYTLIGLLVLLVAFGIFKLAKR
jgi:hypothetical protein